MSACAGLETTEFERCIASPAAVLGLSGLQLAGSGSVGPLTVAAVRERDPRFYAFYVSQSVVDAAPAEGGQVIGPATAPITVVEFTDFECPFCARAYQDLKTALGKEQQDVRVVVRNFPLNSQCNPQIQTEVHGSACRAALAAVCAGAQGRFKEYQGLLFENQSQLDPASLTGYAGRAGLETTEFERCIASPAAAAAWTFCPSPSCTGSIVGRPSPGRRRTAKPP